MKYLQHEIYDECGDEEVRLRRFLHDNNKEFKNTRDSIVNKFFKDFNRKNSSPRVLSAHSAQKEEKNNPVPVIIEESLDAPESPNRGNIKQNSSELRLERKISRAEIEK